MHCPSNHSCRLWLLPKEVEPCCCTAPRAIDTSLLSHAEYQLFLDEHTLQESYHQPDHWQTTCFPPDQGHAAVVGVRPSDATAFCAWLSQRMGGEWCYRLPNTSKREAIHKIVSLEQKHGYWTTDVGEDTCIYPSNNAPNWTHQVMQRNTADWLLLQQGTSSLFKTAIGLARDLDRARVLVSDPEQDQDYINISTRISSLTTSAFVLARDLASFSTQDQASIDDLTRARDHACSLARDLRLLDVTNSFSHQPFHMVITFLSKQQPIKMLLQTLAYLNLDIVVYSATTSDFIKDLTHTVIDSTDKKILTQLNISVFGTERQSTGFVDTLIRTKVQLITKRKIIDVERRFDRLTALLMLAYLDKRLDHQSIVDRVRIGTETR